MMEALELSAAVKDELPQLNKVLRRCNSLEEAAARVRNPQAALACPCAADRVIQADHFPA